MPTTETPTAETERSDEALWERFVDGEDSALDALVRRHEDELYTYLLLSTRSPRTALQHLLNTWEIVAGYRRPYEGFGSFRSWLYAVATQNCVPATHSDTFGLGEVLADIRRAAPADRRSKIVHRLSDLTRRIRQPVLLVGVVGLSIEDASKVCNFTRSRTIAYLERACRFLARSGLFEPGEEDHEL